MIINKVTNGSSTGYAIYIKPSKANPKGEYGPLFKTMREAIKMALRVGL